MRIRRRGVLNRLVRGDHEVGELVEDLRQFFGTRDLMRAWGSVIVDAAHARDRDDLLIVVVIMNGEIINGSDFWLDGPDWILVRRLDDEKMLPGHVVRIRREVIGYMSLSRTRAK